MRLEWLEDLVAILESGSFNEAAARRFVTQPAFSRRIRAIEDYVGAELFDRERKPVGLREPISVHQDDIKRIVAQTRDLLYELRRQSRESHNRIVIASQHAITATLAARVVYALSDRMDISVRLKSGNRDEIHALLMTKQADLLLNYQSASEAASDEDRFIERQLLGQERLIPVFPPQYLTWLDERLGQGELPIVAYPSDAFLGWIFNEELLAQMQERDLVRRKVETALTLAALELAVNGVGVAWVPESLANNHLSNKLLVDLSDRLPFARLTIVAQRLAASHSAAENYLWDDVLRHRMASGALSGIQPISA